MLDRRGQVTFFVILLVIVMVILGFVLSWGFRTFVLKSTIANIQAGVEPQDAGRDVLVVLSVSEHGISNMEMLGNTFAVNADLDAIRSRLTRYPGLVSWIEINGSPLLSVGDRADPLQIKIPVPGGGKAGVTASIIAS